MLISDTYRAMNSELHKTNPDYGRGLLGKAHYKHIEFLAKKMDAASILDYGCGKGRFGQTMPHLLVKNYDPAMEEYSAAPEPADLVVCLDVLEHIEPECLDDVLDDILRLSLRGTFLVISTRAAGKTLPDGRNAHLIQKPPQWWLEKIFSRWDLQLFMADKHEFTVFLFPRQNQAKKSIAA